MAVFELLDKTFFYYPNARSIAMVTTGKERLRIYTYGHIHIGTLAKDNKKPEIDQELFKDEFLRDRLKVIGFTKDDTALALNVTNSDEMTLFSVRNDGRINFNLSNIEGFEIISAERLQYDWLFLRQSRDLVQRSGFHIRDPWPKDDPTDSGNRLEIGYRLPDGTDRMKYFVIHGASGNIGINTEKTETDKVRIRGATNDASTLALNVINLDDVSLLSVRNNGEVRLRGTKNDASAFVLDVKNSDDTRLLGVLNNGDIHIKRPPSVGGPPFPPTIRFDGSKLVLLASSRRFKKNIGTLQENFGAILQAVPRTFVWKESGEPSIGYIAEEFDALGLKHLVTYDEAGQPFSIAHEAIPIYLLEIIKEHHASIAKLEEQNAALEEQVRRANTELDVLKARMAKLESALQKFAGPVAIDAPAGGNGADY